VNTIRSVTRQLSEIGQRARDIADVKRAADDLTAKLTAIERQLVQPSGEEGLQIEPRLLSQIAWVNSIVSSADARPTDQSVTRFNDVKAQLATHLDALRAVIETDVARFNEMVRERGVPPVVVPAAGGRVAAQGEGD
jgi:hypothetical protein